MTLRAYLDAITARAEVATKGPWHQGRVSHGGRVASVKVTPDPHYGDSVCVLWVPEEDKRGLPHWEGNRAFIAHARTDLPRLVQMLRRAIGTLAAIEDTRLTLDELENLGVLRSTAADLVSSAREALAALDALAKEE